MRNFPSLSAQFQSPIRQGEIDNISDSEQYMQKLKPKSFSPGRVRPLELKSGNFQGSKTPSLEAPAQRNKISFRKILSSVQNPDIKEETKNNLQLS